MAALTKRLKMHMRMSGGSLYIYSIFDGETEIGSVSTQLSKKTNSKSVYSLGESEFLTIHEFTEAYSQQKLQAERDKQWEAAAPGKGK